MWDQTWALLSRVKKMALTKQEMLREQKTKGHFFLGSSKAVSQQQAFCIETYKQVESSTAGHAGHPSTQDTEAGQFKAS